MILLSEKQKNISIEKYIDQSYNNVEHAIWNKKKSSDKAYFDEVVRSLAELRYEIEVLKRELEE